MRRAPSRGGGSKERKCPVCGKPATQENRPFCSTRCADVDLHRWLGGVYVIPADETTDESGETPPDGKGD